MSENQPSEGVSSPKEASPHQLPSANSPGHRVAVRPSNKMSVMSNNKHRLKKSNGQPSPRVGPELKKSESIIDADAIMLERAPSQESNGGGSAMLSHVSSTASLASVGSSDGVGGVGGVFGSISETGSPTATSPTGPNGHARAHKVSAANAHHRPKQPGTRGHHRVASRLSPRGSTHSHAGGGAGGVGGVPGLNMPGTPGTPGSPGTPGNFGTRASEGEGGSPYHKRQSTTASATASFVEVEVTKIGSYDVVGQLGKGAFGVVYKAINRTDGKLYAIKRINLTGVTKDERASMEMEIKLLERLKHPNIVSYVDTVRGNSSLAIVLEFVTGGSLQDSLNAEQHRPECLIAFYIRQTLEGLRFLHSQGVIHRDIKGANILATKDGVVKLADFGVATQLNKAGKTHSVVGTPYWMAPEIIQMNAKQDTACDIWSLGCTVLELLTSKPPFFDLHPMSALYQMVQCDHPPFPENVTPSCEDFLRLCFQRDPKKRASADQLLHHDWVVDALNKDGSKPAGHQRQDSDAALRRKSLLERTARSKSQASQLALEDPTTRERDKTEAKVFDDMDDMVHMDHMTAELVLANVRKRFLRDAIYTYVSAILISVNPYSVIKGLYAEVQLLAYHYTRPTHIIQRLTPHIFATARAAYAAATAIDVPESTNQNQSILISGESGAGKTEATKLILRYITRMSSGAGDKISGVSTQKGLRGGHNATDSLESKLMQANPVLEAFGNAKTLRNDNSSRFGKWITINFKRHSTEITGGQIIKYLLEESRVTSIAAGERNYNIFYQVCASSVGNEYDPLTFNYLTVNQAEISLDKISIKGVNDKLMYDKVVEAMWCLGIEEAERQSVFNVVKAVLRLGNLRFVQETQPPQKVVVAKECSHDLRIFAALMGVDVAAVARVLCVKTMISARKSMIHVQRTAENAVEVRDALAKTIYGALFTWLVDRVNVAISGTGGDSRAVTVVSNTTIGILDIFGFEMFAVNSFEQLCINFANEKLQQFFIAHIFKLEQALYAHEGLNIDKMPFADNQPCVDLLSAKPNGVFPVLQDELALPKGSDQGFLEKLHKMHENHAFYFKPRKGGEIVFTIKHYPSPVVYNVTGFLDKNRNKTGEDVVEFFKLHSKIDLVKQLFARGEHEEVKASDPLGGGALGSTLSHREKIMNRKKAQKGGPVSVGSQFQEQLRDLVFALSATTPHFIRCIKPNGDKSQRDGATGFDNELVLEQLRTSGVLDAITVRRLGYPERLPHKEFLSRYKYQFSPQAPAMPAEQERMTHLLEQVSVAIENKTGMRLWQIGAHKVFMKAEVYVELERLRTEHRATVVVLLQKITRGRLARKKMKRIIAAWHHLRKALEAQDLRWIDEALMEATNVGLPKRHVELAWAQREQVLKMDTAKHHLYDALVVPVPSFKQRIALMSPALTELQETLKTMPKASNPILHAFLKGGVSIHRALRLYLQEIEEQVAAAATSKEAGHLGLVLVDKLTAELEVELVRGSGSKKKGGWGLSDDEFNTISQALVKDAAGMEEVQRGHAKIHQLNALGEQLTDAIERTKHPKQTAAIRYDALLTALHTAVHDATQLHFARLELKHAELCVAALEMERALTAAIAARHVKQVDAALALVQSLATKYDPDELTPFLDASGGPADSVADARLRLQTLNMYINNGSTLEIQLKQCLTGRDTAHIGRLEQLLHSAQLFAAKPEPVLGLTPPESLLGTIAAAKTALTEATAIRDATQLVEQALRSEDLTVVGAALAAAEKAHVPGKQLSAIRARQASLSAQHALDDAIQTRDIPALNRAVTQTDEDLSHNRLEVTTSALNEKLTRAKTLLRALQSLSGLRAALTQYMTTNEVFVSLKSATPTPAVGVGVGSPVMSMSPMSALANRASSASPDALRRTTSAGGAGGAPIPPATPVSAAAVANSAPLPALMPTTLYAIDLPTQSAAVASGISRLQEQIEQALAEGASPAERDVIYAQTLVGILQGSLDYAKRMERDRQAAAAQAARQKKEHDDRDQVLRIEREKQEQERVRVERERAEQERVRVEREKQTSMELHLVIQREEHERQERERDRQEREARGRNAGASPRSQSPNTNARTRSVEKDDFAAAAIAAAANESSALALPANGAGSIVNLHPRSMKTSPLSNSHRSQLVEANMKEFVSSKSGSGSNLNAISASPNASPSLQANSRISMAASQQQTSALSASASPPKSRKAGELSLVSSAAALPTGPPVLVTSLSSGSDGEEPGTPTPLLSIFKDRNNNIIYSDISNPNTPSGIRPIKPGEASLLENSPSINVAALMQQQQHKKQVTLVEPEPESDNNKDDDGGGIVIEMMGDNEDEAYVSQPALTRKSMVDQTQSRLEREPDEEEEVAFPLAQVEAEMRANKEKAQRHENRKRKETERALQEVVIAAKGRPSSSSYGEGGSPKVSKSGVMVGSGNDGNGSMNGGPIANAIKLNTANGKPAKEKSKAALAAEKVEEPGIFFDLSKLENRPSSSGQSNNLSSDKDSPLGGSLKPLNAKILNGNASVSSVSVANGKHSVNSVESSQAMVDGPEIKRTKTRSRRRRGCFGCCDCCTCCSCWQCCQCCHRCCCC